MFTDPILFPHYIISPPLFLVNLLTILTLYFIMIYSCFVSYLTYMIVDRFGTVLSFYVLYYCIIIQCSSYLATWLPFLINRLDWIGLDWILCMEQQLASDEFNWDTYCQFIEQFDVVRYSLYNMTLT